MQRADPAPRDSPVQRRARDAERLCGGIGPPAVRGERDDEVRDTLRDLRAHDVEVLTLGQYLAPSARHLPVRRYVSPDAFAAWRDEGLALGFREVVAGPLVRSSYHVAEVLADAQRTGCLSSGYGRMVRCAWLTRRR